MPQAHINDLSVAYEIDGPIGRPTVIFGHCFGADMGFWLPHLPAGEGFRTLRFDSRGHGRSARTTGPYTFPQLAGDVLGLMDHLDIEKAHFVGVSMSGMVGQYLGFDHPERLLSLSLVNTTPRYTPAQQQLWRERADDVLAQGTAHLHDIVMRRWFTDKEIDTEGPGYRYMSAAFRRFHPDSFAACSAPLAALDTVARLSEITVPTMVVAAPDDPGVPPEMSELLAREIPDAILHWLSPARHLATLEHVENFNTQLTAFLRQSA